jgi:polysaccharide biosynthesis protein PslJ
MRVIAGSAERGPIAAAAAMTASLCVLAAAATAPSNVPVGELAITVTLLALFVAAYRSLLQWRMLLAGLLLVILLIPIKRYRMAAGLPFELEPYRIAVMLIAGAWISSLLIDPRVRLRLTGYEAPLATIVLAAIGSVITNGDRIRALAVDDKVLKNLTFLASFVLVFFIIASVARSRRTVDMLLKVLVGGGAVIAVLAVVEARVGFNPFDRLGVLPFMEPAQMMVFDGRGGNLRAYGPAQHPIALGAGLVLLIAPGVYLAWSGRDHRWWAAVFLLVLGALSTMSRTGVVMLLVVGLIFLWLRPRQTKRLWPFLLPVLVIVHFALPGTIGGLKASFFPEGGLIANQSQSVGSRGQGRVADLGPAIAEWSQAPLLGQGYGTRVVDGENPNAQILDNQWLASMLETGLIGVVGLIWLFWRSVRRLGAAAKRDESPDGSFFVAVAASIAAFALGMLTFDAFSFIQVTFFLFILLALAASATALERRGLWNESGTASKGSRAQVG